MRRLSSRKARNLICDPHASLVWQPGAEVYLDAEVELVHDLDTKRQLWDGGVFGYDPAMFFGTFDDADYVLLQLSPTSGTVMEATEHGIVQHRWCR